jgi:hypothetical protein
MIIHRNVINRTLLLLISASLVLLFFLQGCKNPFRTRESPEPIITEGTWDTPFRPEIVVNNLFHAYNEKIIGNFILCLGDSFRFSAPEDSIDAFNRGRPELFAGWNNSTEVSVTTSIFTTFRQNVDSINYVLFITLTTVPDDIGDTTAVLSRNYELYIYNLKSDPPETTLAKGTATFYMRETSLNWWSIYFWSDIPDEREKYESWGNFKAKFRQSSL